MKATITSDGLGHNTCVYDENGNDISRLVSRVEWSVSANVPASAVLHIEMVEMNAVAVDNARMLHDGREVRAIEYTDGERVEFG